MVRAERGNLKFTRPPGRASLNGTAGVLIAGKQCFYFPPQLRIAAASFAKKFGAVFWGALRSAMEQLLDLRPASRSQIAAMHLAFPGEARLPPSASRGGR